MSKTHVELSGKCKSEAYRNNTFFKANDAITINHPIKKGVKGLPHWFAISEESLKTLNAEVEAAKEPKKKAEKAPKKEEEKAPKKEETKVESSPKSLV